MTGSADHGLRMYNMYKQYYRIKYPKQNKERNYTFRNSGKHMKQLYTKAYGHKEWVTSVAFCPNGRILSASMDNYLCHWEARVLKCQNLKAHKY